MLKNNYLIKIIFIIILITLSILITGCSNNEGGLSQVSNYNVNFSVLDESDDPIEGATVTLVGSSKTTDSNGVVTFSKPDGSYDYNVIATGYDPLDGTAIVNGEDVSLNESLSISINTYNVVFSITDTNGDPIEGVTVSLEGENAQTTDSNGMITFSKEDGTYNYDITATGYEDINDNSLTVSGADLTETINLLPTGYRGIYNWKDLDDIRNNLDANYILMNDLNLTTPGYGDLASSSANEGKGWAPIGIPESAYNLEGSFTGEFDGNNKTIADLEINRPDSEEMFTGLFGYIHEGTIKDLKSMNFNIIGYSHVGAIAGINDGGTILNSNISDGSIDGVSTVGGLVGHNFNANTTTNCYSKATVQGNNRIGGLVGYNESSGIKKCYATGNVFGDSECGGLVGYNNYGSIVNNYSRGNVNGNNNIGGLVGFTGNGSTIGNCFSLGAVTGTGTGIGGLVGKDTGEYIANCYYNSETSGQSDTGKGSPRTTKQMKEGSADTTIDGDSMYTDWYTSIWNFGSNTDYPSLSWE